MRSRITICLCLLLWVTGCAATPARPPIRFGGREISPAEVMHLAAYLRRMEPYLRAFKIASGERRRMELGNIIGPVLLSSGLSVDCLTDDLQVRVLKGKLELQELNASESILQAMALLKTAQSILPHDPRVNRAIADVERSVIAYLEEAGVYLKAVNDAATCIAEEIGMEVCDPAGLYHCPP